MKKITAYYLISVLLLFASCSRRPKRVHSPKIDPKQAGEGAIAQYDQDADGKLSKAELQACPGILTKLDLCDKDADEAVTAEEITGRIAEWQKTRVGVLSVSCRVRLSGKPLAGAEVKLEPETFLGEAVKAAAGTTDAYGTAQLTIPADQLPEDQQDLDGVHLGIFKVRITHPTRKLSPKYNTQSTLGCEIDHRDQWNGIKFELSGRS